MTAYSLSLCMAMGIGCNAAGVVGCRIIDSKRERMIAILTNNFMPCNGRFPQPYKGKQKTKAAIKSIILPAGVCITYRSETYHKYLFDDAINLS
jgi:hypothetical protein